MGLMGTSDVNWLRLQRRGPGLGGLGQGPVQPWFRPRIPATQLKTFNRA